MDDERVDNAVRDFLGDSAPVSHLRAMRVALEARLNRLRAEAAADPAARDALRTRILQVERQVRALREEEAISEFVEDTVRAAVADVSPAPEAAPPHDPTLPAWAALDVDDEPEG